MTADRDLVLDFAPPLITLLLAAERSKGAPLTEEEVHAIRGEAACISVPRSMAEALTESRGYADLDPEACWEQWQVVRDQF